MARKRKIPARKHHGVRDPLKQLEEREKKLSKTTNNPPTQVDASQVSYKFKQFQRTLDAVKSGKKIKRVPSGTEDKPKAQLSKIKQQKGTTTTTSPNQFRAIKKLAGETDREYLKRVHRITAQSIREAQFEIKYGVSVLRDTKTGEIKIQKKTKNEIDELLKQKQMEQRIATKPGRNRDKQKLLKALAAKKPTNPIDENVAKQLIKRAIREDNEEQEKEALATTTIPEYKRDQVQFGEIVHAPPTISTLPRRAEKNETVPRPGKKHNLLLQSMLNKDHVDQSHVNVAATAAKLKSNKKDPLRAPTKAQMRGKRKELPMATRSMLENERSKLVNLYRELKKSKTQT